MSEFTDHLRTRAEAAEYRLDPDTNLPFHLGPFELAVTPSWCAILCWDNKWRGKWADERFPTIWDAFEAMLGEYRAWHAKQPRPVVYFIGTELRVGCDVKIGFTRNLPGRLSTLQTSSPVPLKVFATVPGGPEVEDKYHRRWRTRRRSGEWFTLGKCIIDEIDRLNATAPPSPGNMPPAFSKIDM